MSIDKHSDDCPGCRPALVNAETGKVLGPDTPIMMLIDSLWEQTTKEERLAFHRVTCQNSRAPADLRLFDRLAAQFQAAVSAMPT